MVVEVRGTKMVCCDFGRKSQQNLVVDGGFVRYEAGRGRVRFRLRTSLGGVTCLQVHFLRKPSSGRAARYFGNKSPMFGVVNDYDSEAVALTRPL